MKKLTEAEIKEIQEAVLKIDREITSPHLRNVNRELLALYNELAEKIPARKREGLEVYLLQAVDDIHETIKRFYW